MPLAPRAARIFYMAGQAACLAIFTLLYRMRSFHTARVPRSGPLLIVSNHQSHLDPPVIGSAIRRRHARFLARAGLFRFAPFAAIIRALGAFPIQENSGDRAALRACVGLLRGGQAVLVFPEGSRSPDGSVHPFKRGVWLILTQAKCAVLPVGVSGCFDAWPRSSTLPRLFSRARIRVRVGEPIPYAQLELLSSEDGLNLLRERVAALAHEPSAMPCERC